MNLSFIKLDINIMNDTKIKLLRKMPEGDSVLVLWIGLLCLAMKSGKPGILELGDGIPFTDEMLSIEFDVPINTVRLGLKTFQTFKMIEVWDNGQTYITNFEKHQTLCKIETAQERSRVNSKNHREKMKQLSRDSHVTVTSSNSDPPDKDKDKEKKEILSDESNDKKPDEPFYLTAKKRKLKGKRLESFEQFWEAFGYKSGKAHAADAWLDIPELKPSVVAVIIKAAEAEAKGRPEKKASGGTPIMAQGWLTARRWEDEVGTTQPISYTDQCKAEQDKYQPTPEELLG